MYNITHNRVVAYKIVTKAERVGHLFYQLFHLTLCRVTIV